ncbi:MAG: menaquinone biosynthesis decarboxylase [bacterium]
MTYKDLREFIQKLKDEEELLEINVPVDSNLEITEITDRASKNKDFPNKALLFNKVDNYDIPVLINSFGSFKRMNLALGVDNIKEIASRIENLIKTEVPDSMIGKVSMLSRLYEVSSFFPQIIKNAPCQEIVITDLNQPILDKLPILKCWAEDGGKFITLPVVITKNPLTGVRNAGMYRLQKFDNVTTGMHWHKHHDGALNFEAAKRLGKKFEAAVALGCDPATIYASVAPVPSGIDEMIFAGFLRKKPVKLVKCKTVDLEVPAYSEIVLEGYINFDEQRMEGPFGDHTGYYSAADLYPVFHITAMTHRKNPVYPATIVGKPPQEDCYMGKATEQIFLPILKQIIPEIVNINLPIEGVFHNCAIISINKHYPGHANKVISAVWGLGQLMFTKFVIIVDYDINIHDLSEVSWRIFNNVDPARDCIITKGPVDILDHASDLLGYGGKMGIDATKKWKSEGISREFPNEITMSDEIKKKVDSRLQEYLS